MYEGNQKSIAELSKKDMYFSTLKLTPISNEEVNISEEEIRGYDARYGGVHGIL